MRTYDYFYNFAHFQIKVLRLNQSNCLFIKCQSQCYVGLEHVHDIWSFSVLSNILIVNLLWLIARCDLCTIISNHIFVNVIDTKLIIFFQETYPLVIRSATRSAVPASKPCIFPQSSQVRQYNFAEQYVEIWHNKEFVFSKLLWISLSISQERFYKGVETRSN